VPQPLKTALPPKLNLGGAWRVEWDAIDPATGDTVPGVIISDTSLHVEGSEQSLAAVANPILLGVSAA